MPTSCIDQSWAINALRLIQQEVISSNRLLLAKEVIRKIRFDELIVCFLARYNKKQKELGVYAIIVVPLHRESSTYLESMC